MSSMALTGARGSALGRDDDAARALARAAAEFARLRVPRELEQSRALLGTLSPTR